MRMKRFSLFLLALVFITSLAVVGCGSKGATFTVSNLVISPSPVDAGSAVTISAQVANSGGASGSYTATLKVGGADVETKSVEIAAGASATVTFTYTASVSGTFTVSIGGQSGSLVVNEAIGYWDIPYKAVEGSYIVLNYSAGGMTPLTKVLNFDESNGITLTIRVNKEEVNGAREVIIPKATWVFPEFKVKNIMAGMDMDLILGIDHDAVGTLYVQDGIGDVDMSSVSTAGQTPIQVDTFGDGTMDPAGSMVIPIPLVGDFDTPAGNGALVFNLVFTTGHTDNTVHITIRPKMNGAVIESDGILFEEDGGLAPYVGTAGTLTTTGTGDCLGIKLVGTPIDFQYRQVLVLEPVE